MVFCVGTSFGRNRRLSITMDKLDTIDKGGRHSRGGSWVRVCARVRVRVCVIGLIGLIGFVWKLLYEAVVKFGSIKGHMTSSGARGTSLGGVVEPLESVCRTQGMLHGNKINGVLRVTFAADAP